MRAIANGEANNGDKTLAILNYTTFNSVVGREYVTIDSHNNPTLTQSGLTALQTYQELPMPLRSHPGKVSQFVADFLGPNPCRQGVLVGKSLATLLSRSRMRMDLLTTYD